MRDALTLFKTLETDAHQYDFFQLVRLIENAFPEQARIGTSLRPRDDALRFAQDPVMAFQPAALASFQSATDSTRARLVVNFFGLTGPNAPLPMHLTDYVRDRLRNANDPTPARFLDIFHHRLLSLFYRARAVAEPAIQLDREKDDRFATYVGSLFGLGSNAQRMRDSVPDFGKLHFAGLLAQRVRNGSGLVTILSKFFQVPVQLEQFVGHWMRLPLETRTRMGALDGSSTLGSGTVLGGQVWNCQSKFRLVIGALDAEQYARFLPGGASLQGLIDWVRNYCGDALEWDVRLLLKKEAIVPARLGAAHLGFTSRLYNRAPTCDANDLVFTPSRYDE